MGENMRTITCRACLTLAILGFFAPLSMAQAVHDPLSDRDLLALVAGNSLSENIVHEIETRGLAFRPGDQFRSLLTEAGADSRIIAALNNANASDTPSPAENSDASKLLQHLADAGKFRRNKKYAEAAQELTAALQDGGGAETGFVMAEVLRGQEQWSNAETILREVQRQAPDFQEAHTKLSYELYRINDGEGALSEARIALAENPNDAEAHKNAGLALQILNRFNASEVEYNEALRLKPDYEPARMDLGLLFASQNKLDRAIVEYKKAIALDATDEMVHSNLGFAYASKGDHDSAIPEYREAIRLDPTDFISRQNLGHSFLARGMYPEAIKEFRELVGIAPDSAICHDCLAGAFYQASDYPEAETEYRKAIALDPSLADAHVGLGNIRYQMKGYAAALEEYRQAEKLDPTLDDAYRGAGKSLLAKKDFSGATEELKRAENLKLSDPTTHDLYGQALVGLGNNSGAIAEFKQAIALDPMQIQVRLELAAALEKNDNWVEALEQYHQAAMADRRPEIQDQYKTVQARFNQHLAALKASGKSAEAAELGTGLRASKVDPGISEKLDTLMQQGNEAMAAQRFEEADKDYKEAVDLAGKLQPPDDRLASALMTLAGFYGRKNDFVHAEAAMQRGLKVTADLHGAESPAMTRPLQNFGFYSLYRRDFNTALEYFSRAEAVNEKAYGENSDKVALSLIYEASVYIVQQDYAKAEPLLLRAMRIDESLMGADSPGMNPVLSSLTDLYNRWDKPEKAEPRYRQLLAVLEKQFGPDSPVLLSTLSNEAKMLSKLGRAEEAEKYEQRIQSIRAATGQPEGDPSAQQLPR
jgi:tetratricopeptide (TPR) repeat protein